MYAVVTSGGKQYKVEEGETLKVEKIPGDVGSSVKFDRVLMIADGDSVSIGQPVLDDALVEGHIVEQGKSKKIIVIGGSCWPGRFNRLVPAIRWRRAPP